MKFVGNKAEDIKIAYIGGGSRGWAWGLMSDLAVAGDMSGDVYLYDIDYEAAQHNEIIGNKYNDIEETTSKWNYKAVKTIGEALTGANFVVISILPGTFDEMESDLLTPEKYNIYQSVGDTTGPGGIVRALRTIPMMEEIAKAIEKYSPEAWVINYTNPMAICVKALYNAFPKIKAFGCCHEVFGTQKFLAKVLNEELGIADVAREEIKVSVLGVNHFTWLNKATYRDIDLFPIYKEYCRKNAEKGCCEITDMNWANATFATAERIKMNLFQRYGYIAAAGDRHLAEFCEKKWYLDSRELVAQWKFGLTPASWRKKDLVNRLESSRKILDGEQKVSIKNTGEEGVNQMRALLGLCDIVTNVNIPNQGQISNLPIGAVVETNAVFTANSLTPVFVGNIPEEINAMILRVCQAQSVVAKAGMTRDLELAFNVFVNDPLVDVTIEDARKLFGEMIENTRKYLTDYDVDGFNAR